MLKVKYNHEWVDDPDIKNAVQYSDEQFSELSKIWADLGFELLVHKQEVNPKIDIIQRDADNRIYDAKTIGVGDWFIFNPEDYDYWYVISNEEFSKRYTVIDKEVSHV